MAEEQSKDHPHRVALVGLRRARGLKAKYLFTGFPLYALHSASTAG